MLDLVEGESSFSADGSRACNIDGDLGGDSFTGDLSLVTRGGDFSFSVTTTGDSSLSRRTTCLACPFTRTLLDSGTAFVLMV